MREKALPLERIFDPVLRVHDVNEEMTIVTRLNSSVSRCCCGRVATEMYKVHLAGRGVLLLPQHELQER